jgi:hypothetical protein
MTASVGTFEECADELNDFVSSLEGYPPMVLAFVFRAHLSGLLQALRMHGDCSEEDLASFLEDMTREVLEQVQE